MHGGVKTKTQTCGFVLLWWRKLPSQGSKYALTWFGLNKVTAMGAAKHSSGI